MEASKETCAICLGSMKAGDGSALFTAECSHIFHFNCIASNVQHGNHICPVCRSTWTNLPSQLYPTFNFFTPMPYTFQQLPSPPPAFHASPLEFADDEPLPAPPQSPTPAEQSTSTPHQDGGITVKALSEYPALSRSEQSDSFAVLVGIRAPPMSPEATDRPGTRAPLDLVAVLDVSGSMHGDKIRLLQQAVNFVVDNLGPTDRFSIVTFATFARRVTPLRRMTDAGRAEMAHAVNSLRANGSTNIIAGLKKAVQVLEQRREKNPVTSIILLSDGQDNQNAHSPDGFLRSLSQLPASIRSRNDTQNDTNVVSVPVHTFGFGSDHDATSLHAVADGSGGTFSYIESIEIIQDAFAQCLGGLLSVVAQEVEIKVQSSSPGVRILSIPSGRCRNTINNDDVINHGVIYVGDLYAEEEKQFLVYLSIKQETDSSTTQLLEVRCSYKELLSNENIVSETKRVEIRRPLMEDLSEEEKRVCLEVDRERNRLLVAEGIAQAQMMAERGDLEGARSLLDQRRQNVLSSDSAQGGDATCGWLDHEMRGIQQQMQSRTQYEACGRAYALSKKSSHQYQRATTQALQVQQQSLRAGSRTQVPLSGSSGPATQAYSGDDPARTGYETSFMRQMVTKSQLLRQSKQHEEAAASNSSSSP